MKNIFIFFIISSLLILSCSKPEKEIKQVDNYTEEVHTKHELSVVMSEFFIAEAIIHKSVKEGKDMNKTLQTTYHNIFTRYNTNYEKVKQSMNYYSRNNELDEILDEVINILTEKDLNLKNN